MTFELKPILNSFIKKGNVNLLSKVIMDALPQAEENKVMGFVTEVALQQYFENATTKKMFGTQKVERVRLSELAEEEQDYPDLIIEFKDGTAITIEVKSRVDAMGVKTPWEERGGAFPTVAKKTRTLADYIRYKKGKILKNAVEISRKMKQGEYVLQPTDYIIFVDMAKFSGKITEDWKAKTKKKLTFKTKTQKERDQEIIEFWKKFYGKTKKKPYVMERIWVMQIQDLEDYSKKFKEKTVKGKSKQLLEQKQLKFSTLNRMFKNKEESKTFFVVDL